MNNYTLKHKDINLIIFAEENDAVISAVLLKGVEDYLPLPLKWILEDKGHILSEYEKYYVLNDEGCGRLDNWFSDREVPVNRDNLEKYIGRGKNVRKWMIESRGVSFDDCYWIEKQGEETEWNTIKLSLCDLDEFRTIRENDSHSYSKRYNSTLGGELEVQVQKD